MLNFRILKLPVLKKKLKKEFSQSFMNTFNHLVKKHDLVTTQTLKNSLEKPQQNKMKADKLRIINSSHKSLPTVQVKKTIQAFVLRKDSSVKTYIL